MIESEPTTQIQTHPMNTVKLFCPQGKLADVIADMMKSGVKYYPVRRYNFKHGPMFHVGYHLELEADHPIVSFLILKHSLNTLSEHDIYVS